ncbi:unnamed protein product [Psylliodes chrysocephalus]|uniref:DDB1-and CUL4-associated factor 8 n=1 Tax=Psylliodes chrysocephalus TaxID=3402493 RepID=A0A9P0D4U0_9CUCU|nr:unnamed protein product [Psylliodes chrysocephala]
MDENMSDDESREKSSNKTEKPKRLKSDGDAGGSSVEESSSSSSNVEQVDESQEILTKKAENPKRLKTEGESGGSVEESSSSSNNIEQETASTSTDSGFPRSRNSKNRNYRNHSSNGENRRNVRRLYTPPNFGEELFSSGDEEPQEAVEDDEADSAMHEEDSANLDELDPMSNMSSNSTVINDTDIDSDDEEHPTLKKEYPKHNWFMVPEVLNRQLGSSSKYQSADLFQKRCYGSLRSVHRLELMYKLEGHDGCVNSLNFHPQGHLLASGSDDLKVILWDWKIGKQLLKYESRHRGNVFQTKFLNLSGDLHIASCARDGQVRIAQVSAEEGVRDNRKLGCHRGPCHKIAVLTEQPHVILSAGEDGYVFSHDVRKNKQERIVSVKDDEREVALYSIHGNPLKSLEFCVSGRDEIIRVYDQRKSNDTLHTYHPFKKRTDSSGYTGLHVTCAIYNHDGSEILGSYNDGDVFLFDVNAEPGNFLHQYQGHRNGATIKGVNFFGPNSEFIVSGSDCGYIYFWERNTEAIVQWLLADDNGVVNCLEPHPQVPYICTSGLDWDVKVWVPSCENDPTFKGLSSTVKNNNKARSNWTSMIPPDINESQMLWMLWRHLRSSNRLRREFPNGGEGDTAFFRYASTSSSSSGSSSSSIPSDEDDLDVTASCSPS